MEQSKTPNHRARHKTRAALLSDKGLDAANHYRASGGGRRMFLTSPLIEQAITPHTLAKPVCTERYKNEHDHARDEQWSHAEAYPLMLPSDSLASQAQHGRSSRRPPQ